MKTIKQFLGALVICLVEIIVGSLLFINLTNSIDYIMAVCASILIGWGLLCSVTYFRMEPTQARNNNGLFRGLCLLSLGAGLISKWNNFTPLLPLIAPTCGIAVFINGLLKIQWSVDFVRLRKGKWYLIAISASASLLMSSVILINPFPTIDAHWMFSGASLICEAILDIISFLFCSQKPGK